MLQAKKFTLTIKYGHDKGVYDGFGVTDGKKWHVRLFPTKEAAEAWIKLGEPWDELSIKVNIGYPAPTLAPEVNTGDPTPENKS